EERGRRRRRLWLGGPHPTATAVLPDHRVRDARGRVHPSSELRPLGKDTWHVRRPHRKDPLSPATGHHGGGAAYGLPIRPSGLAPRAGELLGLCPRVLLRAPPGLQL